MSRLQRLIAADRQLRLMIDVQVRLSQRGAVESDFAINRIAKLIKCLNGVAAMVAWLANNP